MTDKPLAGDMLARAAASPDPLPPRERTTALDPQSIAEFLAYDVEFREEPSVGVVFPPETERG